MGIWTQIFLYWLLKSICVKIPKKFIYSRNYKIQFIVEVYCTDWISLKNLLLCLLIKLSKGLLIKLLRCIPPNLANLAFSSPGTFLKILSCKMAHHKLKPN